MNNLREVERHARALMTLHGVGSLEFGFDNHKKTIGQCHYVRLPEGPVLAFKITLSRHFAAVLTMEEIRETMLHEIAHALVPYGSGHGPVWQRKARELGIKPAARKATSAAPKAAWEAVCPSCGIVRAKYHRAPLKAGWLCGAASCKTKSVIERLLVWHKHGSVVLTQDMPDRYYRDWLRIQKTHNPRFKETA